MGRIEPAGGLIDVGAMMGDRLAVLAGQGERPGEERQGQGAATPRRMRSRRTIRWAELESRTLRALQLEAAELNVKKAKATELGMAAHEQKIKLIERGLAQAKKDEERIKGTDQRHGDRART